MLVNFTSEIEMRSVTGTITFIAPLLDYLPIAFFFGTGVVSVIIGLRSPQLAGKELVAWQCKLPITADTFAWCDGQIVFGV